MSIKIIADSRDEFPENLRSEAKEVEGKFEINGDGVIKKNAELLGKNAKLSTRAEEAEAAKEAADARAKEWKGKAAIPAGQKIAPEDVVELGEAAKEAGLAKDELPTLKTAKADLQNKLDAIDEQKIRSDAAASVGKKFENFDDHATAKNLKLSRKTEKQGDKDVDYYVVIGKDSEGKDTETRISDYVKDKSLPDVKEVGNRVLGQESGNDGRAGSEWDQYRAEGKAAAQSAAPPPQSSMFAALENK